MNSEESYITTDRMRFVKNTKSSRLALLAIAFNVLFFINIYKSDVGKHYYTILIGASIVYNLVFMLTAFLASEAVKNYNRKFSALLIILGVIQIARILIYPRIMHSAVIGAPTETVIHILGYHIPATLDNVVMGVWQFVRCVVYLVCSALCLFMSAAVNLKKSRMLSNHVANLGIQR